MTNKAKNKKQFYDTAIPEDWAMKRFDEFAPLQRGFDLPLDRIIEGKYPVVFSNGILKFHNEFKSTAPGVVTGRSGTIGKVTFVETDFWPHNTSLWVTDFKNNHPLFVFYYLMYLDLNRFGSGSGVPTLNRNDVHSVKVFIPPLPEQKAIASVLSTWDDSILKTEQLIAQKELRKKWLMQQLLTGKKRLKGFDGEWKEMTLNEIGEFSKGAGIMKAEVVEDGLLAIRYGELYTKHDTIIYDIDTFISDETSYFSKKIINGDILIAGSGETKEEIGRCAAYVFDEIAFAGGDIIIFRPFRGDSCFLAYLLNSDQIKAQKSSMAKGHSVVHIYPKDLAKIEIQVPNTEEQIEIADILLLADKEITLLRVKADKLREQKKGLMQMLLTGKKRLNYDSFDSCDDHDLSINHKNHSQDKKRDGYDTGNK